MQADGKILVGAFATTTSRATMDVKFNRLVIDSATGTQKLTVSDYHNAQWLRSGSVPEVSNVTFEVKVNDSRGWLPLGVGARIPGGWESKAINLPTQNFSLRACGQYVSGVIEQVLEIGAQFSP